MQRVSKLKVINLFGAPGRGKSAARSGLFWLMKAHHMSVEEVSEYAKYLVLTGRTWQLKEEQLYLFSKQYHKQHIIERTGYEYAATDSPLQLSAFYSPAGYFHSFEALIDEAYHRYDNINFFLSRDVREEDYEERGREQDHKASIEVELKQREFLARKNIKYVDINVDMFTPWNILEHIAPGLAIQPVFPVKKDCERLLIV